MTPSGVILIAQYRVAANLARKKKMQRKLIRSVLKGF